MQETILVVDSEGRTGEIFREQCDPDHLNVSSADNVPMCLRFLYERRPQLVVLVLSSEHHRDIELCRLIRQMCDVPILFLTSQESDGIVIDCLEAGADDCVTKDVSMTELKARVLALLRRCGPIAGPFGRRVTVGDICIYVDDHRVTKGGNPVALTPREFRVLSTLAERVGCVVPHAELLSRVWGTEFVNDTHYLRLYIGYLRQKLEDDPRNPLNIHNEWGVGYRLGAIAMTASPARSYYSPPTAAPHPGRAVPSLASGT